MAGMTRCRWNVGTARQFKACGEVLGMCDDLFCSDHIKLLPERESPIMTSKETAEKMAALTDAMNEAEKLSQRARRGLARSEKLLRDRYRQVMQTDIEATGARREFSDFCQGVRKT